MFRVKSSALAIFIAFLMGLCFTQMANATDTMSSALGGQVVYDATTNLSWIANANLMASNTFGLTYGTNYGNDSYGNPSIINSNGTATWGGAMKWIAAMNAANYLGYSDWSLPTADPSVGLLANDTTSQMGNLYYNALGGIAGRGIPILNNANFSLFSNYQADYYWTGTDYFGTPSKFVFATLGGFQINGQFYNNFFAMAVRSGPTGLAPQNITFGTAPSVPVGSNGVVTATGGASGNPVTLSAAPATICTLTGSTVTGVALGICTVTANQAGNASYLAAPTVTQSFSVTAATTTGNSGGDVPLPPWALVLLAAGLLGTIWRQQRTAL
jgi:hypothetical protein